MGGNIHFPCSINRFRVASSDDAPPRVVKGIDCLPVRARDQVAVRVDGDLDGVVAELLLDVGERFAVRDQPRREGMAQVVEPDPPQARVLQRRKNASRTRFGSSGDPTLEGNTHLDIVPNEQLSLPYTG